MEQPIKAIVFDSDGTLIDGFKVMCDAYTHVATLHGRPAPSREEVAAQMALARSVHEMYQTFFPGEDVAQMLRENGEYIMANATNIPGFAGLHEMFAALQGRGLTFAIVTGGNHKVHDLFRHHDIEQHFASIVHADRVERSKPDPEGFLLAMDECGTKPSESVMIGDSPNDIFAGKNAGARYTIGITHGHGSQQALRAADPDYIVHSLPELTELLLRLTTPVS